MPPLKGDGLHLLALRTLGDTLAQAHYGPLHPHWGHRLALAAQRRRQYEIAAIDAALRRIGEGEYGYCLICDDVIAGPRLRHHAAVTSCIRCARDNA